MKTNLITTQPGERRIGIVNGYGLLTLYKKEVHRYFKVWTQTVAAPMITVSLFMAVFMWALAGDGRASGGVSLGTFLAPGLMIMAILQNAFQNPMSSILVGKVQGSIVDVLMPPLSPMELLAGFVLGGITRGLTVGCALFVAFYFWPGVSVSMTHVWAVIYFGFSAATMLSLVGVLTGVWAEKFDHGAAITNFVIGPLTLLSGTFYTIERLPEILQTFSHFNPFFYLIDGFRYGYIGHADGDLTMGVWYILFINVALFLAAYRIIKTGYRLKA